MSKIKTFKGKLPIGVQEKLHLSTADGLTGYRINKFQIISEKPGTDDYEYVAKIYLTDQTGNESVTIDFSDTDLIASIFYKGRHTSYETAVTDTIILDRETFNQDIFIYVMDAGSGTIPCNFYIELEQFSLDLNSSTYHTLKNIRSSTQV